MRHESGWNDVEMIPHPHQRLFCPIIDAYNIMQEMDATAGLAEKRRTSDFD